MHLAANVIQVCAPKTNGYVVSSSPSQFPLVAGQGLLTLTSVNATEHAES